MPTFHPLRSAFIPPAPQKVPLREVAEAVSHLLMPSSDHVAALGLSLVNHVASDPTWFRRVEKARPKSVTPLTSRSPMSPHLVVAVVMFWT